LYSFKLGADPEVFCGDASGVRSVIGKIGGSKAQPLPLPIGEGFAVQEDNVALEFNIPASANKAEWVANIALATGYLESMVQEEYGFSFVKESAVSFPTKELNDPAALVFGCDPDYNAWTLKRNPRPRSPDKNLRSCGGHIHIGNSDVDPVGLIRACDLFLGVPSVLMDKGSLRRSLYGKAGAFRKKDYGAEYRTLSNFWVFDRRLTEWAYDNTERALGWAFNGEPLDNDREAILAAIDDANMDAARLLVHKYSLEVVA
jgi:hypothetical protein